jgi:putative addiction module killer protein
MALEVRKTVEFGRWIDALRDPVARARVVVRVERLSMGNAGDVKPIGEGVSEMRIDYGPGYRVYYTLIRKKLVLLLIGGDKKSQASDIKEAYKIAERERKNQ